MFFVIHVLCGWYAFEWKAFLFMSSFTLVELVGLNPCLAWANLKQVTRNEMCGWKLNFRYTSSVKEIICWANQSKRNYENMEQDLKMGNFEASEPHFFVCSRKKLFGYKTLSIVTEKILRLIQYTICVEHVTHSLCRYNLYWIKKLMNISRNALQGSK